MSLVFAAVVPHSPILIPSIGRDHLERLKRTTDALKSLEQELYARNPDAILIISPHGPVSTDHFTIDFNDHYTCSLKEFGVFDSQIDCGAHMRLTNDLREHLEDRGLPIMLRSEEALDYGTIVPLIYLAGHLPNPKILPLFPSLLPLKTHFDFGQVIKEVVMNSTVRVAIVASADLSHRLTEEAPGGFSSRAKEFDDKISALIRAGNGKGLVDFDLELAREAGECSLSTLTTFMGAMDGIGASPEVLSYEGPFGIGYLVAHYKFA